MTIEKFKACLLLASFGDTFGFKNGSWEFNYGNSNAPLEMSINYILEFIFFGGINHINLKNWSASDDTILKIATAKALVESNNYIENFVKEYIDIIDELDSIKRVGGKATINSINLLNKTNDINSIVYNESSGGNGASIRSMAIGLAFHGKNNRNKLIEYSIENGRLTHNHVLGYLGSFVTALFVSYGIENIHPFYWCDKLIKLFDSGIVDAYIDKKGRDVELYHKNKDLFINKWRIFQEKFKERSYTNEVYITGKLRFYERYFSPQVTGKNGKKDYGKIGASGIDSIIIAYDSLLLSIINKNREHGQELKKLVDRLDIESKSKKEDLDTKLNNTTLSWEKLVIHSMLHVGDSDSTGTIAAAWFGAYQGFKDVPSINIENLEFKKDIIKLAEQLFKKFNT